MSARERLTIIYNVLVVDGDRGTRNTVRDTLRTNRALRVVGNAADLGRACSIAKRKAIDIIVIGRVGTGATKPILVLLRLAPYARLFLFATDLPDELSRSLAGENGAVAAPDLTALVDAITGISGHALKISGDLAERG